jgi:hypothetical protein
MPNHSANCGFFGSIRGTFPRNTAAKLPHPTAVYLRITNVAFARQKDRNPLLSIGVVTGPLIGSQKGPLPLVASGQRA